MAYVYKVIDEENILKALHGNKHLPPLMKELLIKIAERNLLWRNVKYLISNLKY
jgi:hypothetical protein